MEKQAAALQKKIEQLRLDDERKNQWQTAATGLLLYAKHGQAREALLAGDFGKVRELTDPVVQDLIKGAGAGNEGLSRSLILLNLRANVQEGKLERAEELLNLLQKSEKPDDIAAGSNVLLGLVADLKEQVDAVKKLPQSQEQLTKMQTSFSTFLDKLAQQKFIPPRNVLFLANSYSNVGNHKAALTLLKDHKIPDPHQPKDLDADEKQIEEKVAAYNKKMQEYQEKRGLYHAARHEGA